MQPLLEHFSCATVRHNVGKKKKFYLKVQGKIQMGQNYSGNISHGEDQPASVVILPGQPASVVILLGQLASREVHQTKLFGIFHRNREMPRYP